MTSTVNHGKQLYAILCLENFSAADEVRAAYKAMALRYHPDKNLHDPSAAIRFQEVRRAYEVLSNAESKQKYDAALRQAIKTGGGSRASQNPYRVAPTPMVDVYAELLRRQAARAAARTRTASATPKEAPRTSSQYTKAQQESFRKKERDRQQEFRRQREKERQEQRDRERETLRREQEKKEEQLQQRWQQQRTNNAQPRSTRNCSTPRSSYCTPRCGGPREEAAPQLDEKSDLPSSIRTTTPNNRWSHRHRGSGGPASPFTPRTYASCRASPLNAGGSFNQAAAAPMSAGADSMQRSFNSCISAEVGRPSPRPLHRSPSSSSTPPPSESQRQSGSRNGVTTSQPLSARWTSTSVMSRRRASPIASKVAGSSLTAAPSSRRVASSNSPQPASSLPSSQLQGTPGRSKHRPITTLSGAEKPTAERAQGVRQSHHEEEKKRRKTAVAGSHSSRARRSLHEEKGRESAEVEAPLSAGELLEYLIEDEISERVQLIEKEEQLSWRRLHRSMALAAGEMTLRTRWQHLHHLEVVHRNRIAKSYDMSVKFFILVAGELRDRRQVEMVEATQRRKLAGREVGDIYHLNKGLKRRYSLASDETALRGSIVSSATDRHEAILMQEKAMRLQQQRREKVQSSILSADASLNESILQQQQQQCAALAGADGLDASTSNPLTVPFSLLSAAERLEERSTHSPPVRRPSTSFASSTIASAATSPRASSYTMRRLQTIEGDETRMRGVLVAQQLQEEMALRRRRTGGLHRLYQRDKEEAVRQERRIGQSELKALQTELLLLRRQVARLSQASGPVTPKTQISEATHLREASAPNSSSSVSQQPSWATPVLISTWSASSTSTPEQALEHKLSCIGEAAKCRDGNDDDVVLRTGAH